MDRQPSSGIARGAFCHDKRVNGLNIFQRDGGLFKGAAPGEFLAGAGQGFPGNLGCVAGGGVNICPGDVAISGFASEDEDEAGHPTEFQRCSGFYYRVAPPPIILIGAGADPNISDHPPQVDHNPSGNTLVPGEDAHPRLEGIFPQKSKGINLPCVKAGLRGRITVLSVPPGSGGWPTPSLS